MLPIIFACWLLLIYVSLWPNAIVLVPLSVIMIFIIIYDWISLRRLPRRAVSNALQIGHGRSALGLNNTSICPEQICVRTSSSYEEVKWHAIRKITKTKEFAYIYYTPYTAFIIPKRAFAQPEAFESFVMQAQEYHKQSQDYGLICEKCGFDLRGVTDPGCPECGWRREE